MKKIITLDEAKCPLNCGVMLSVIGYVTFFEINKLRIAFENMPFLRVEDALLKARRASSFILYVMC